MGEFLFDRFVAAEKGRLRIQFVVSVWPPWLLEINGYCYISFFEIGRGNLQSISFLKSFIIEISFENLNFIYNECSKQ